MNDIRWPIRPPPGPPPAMIDISRAGDRVRVGCDGTLYFTAATARAVAMMLNGLADEIEGR